MIKENINYSWEVQNYTECSVKCGKGSQRIIWKCMQTDIYDMKTQKDDIDCSHVPQPPSEGICDGSCPRWKFSDWGKVPFLICNWCY